MEVPYKVADCNLFDWAQVFVQFSAFKSFLTSFRMNVKVLVFVLVVKKVFGQIAPEEDESETGKLVEYLEEVIDYYLGKDPTQTHNIAFVKLPGRFESSVHDQLVEKVSRSYSIILPPPTTELINATKQDFDFLKVSFCVFFSEGNEMVNNRLSRLKIL